MEALPVEAESERPSGLETLQSASRSAPARASHNRAQLLATGWIFKAVILFFPKSRMREIRTYGSVVGPAQTWAGLPDLRIIPWL